MTEITVRHTLMGLADTAVEAGTITEGKYLEIADYLKDSPEITESPIDLNYPETTAPDTDNYQRSVLDIDSPLLLPEEIIGGARDEAAQYLQSLTVDFLARKRENDRRNNENNIGRR
jgi:hypothetical protein